MTDTPACRAATTPRAVPPPAPRAPASPSRTLAPRPSLWRARRNALGGGSGEPPPAPEEGARPSHERVREMIDAGLLPRVRETSIWGGPSTGQPCDLCGQAIGVDDYEYEIGRSGERSARLHLACLVVWLEAQGES